jgi:hypothetical protein
MTPWYPQRASGLRRAPWDTQLPAPLNALTLELGNPSCGPRRQTVAAYGVHTRTWSMPPTLAHLEGQKCLHAPASAAMAARSTPPCLLWGYRAVNISGLRSVVIRDLQRPCLPVGSRSEISHELRAKFVLCVGEALGAGPVSV